MVALLACNALAKTYGRGTIAETALAGVTLKCARGETCLLLGPSGSGKTTLLSILGCLLSPTDGQVEIEGERVPYGRPGKLIALRRDKIGFVFQQAQLLPFLTVESNLRVVAKNAGLRRPEIRQRIGELTDALGIRAYRHRKPAELSGGQRQRVAIARALLHRPPIILADEPTASLDWENGQAAIRLLIEQAKAENSLLIVVTHDTRLVPLFDRVLQMESGKILSDSAIEAGTTSRQKTGTAS
ncbi:MAG: ABC transporter ATP-binding protein [Thermomicrobiales bacterium]